MDSAATELTDEAQLAELVNQEAGSSTNITLKVIRSEMQDYSYARQGNQVTTQKLQIVLQSKIAEQYCLGVAKLQRKNKNELKTIADRWQIGTTWRFKALPLLNDKPAYIHTPCRINRSAQGKAGGAATEHVFPTDTSANSYHRRCITIKADAAIRSHGHSNPNHG